MPSFFRSVHRLLAFTLMIVLVGIGFVPRSSTSVAESAAAPRTVFVHLFEWKWTDIAKECENWLGPKGFSAVQVSPPQEHIQGSQWWTRYQPVSYKFESRSGSRSQFANMVSRCNAVGVDVYVDAVINHMTGQAAGGTGVAGSPFSHYDYPGTYSGFDFHYCGRNGNNDISNYGDRWEVQNCELVNLSDLETESDYVRGRVAAYLNDAISMGVDGFRIDAAKHMPTGDINNIVSRLDGDPYIFQEVIDQGGEPIKANEYFQNGDVTEFKYSQEIGRVFDNGKLTWLSNFGEAWGFMGATEAVVFTDNHDNQRGHGGGGHVLTYKDGALYTIGNVFMLAWPYGYPKVMSSYEFSNGDQGPPSGTIYGSGNTANCFGQWKCEHRWRQIANMVAFRNYTNGAGVSNWWSNGNNQIAFSRGTKGFVAINRESNALGRTFNTGLAAGTYCDVIHGDYVNGTCTGPTVSVNSSGQATMNVGSMDAVALHVGAKVNAGTTVATRFNVQATTNWGQNVYVVGNVTQLGNWNTASAVALSSANYPTWSGNVNLPANTSIEYKYIKKDANGTVVWESGSNRMFTTPGSGTTTRNDTWR